MHKKRAVYVAVIGAIALAGCSKTDPNEKNFGAAISAFYEKNGELCLGPLVWPVELNQSYLTMTNPNSDIAKMRALEAAGLVKSEDDRVTRKGIIPGTSYTENVKRFTLTDAAKPYGKEKEVRVFFSTDGATKKMGTDLCWGHVALDKVVKWEGPMKLGDYQEATVIHTYKIERVASWATRPDIQSAYRDVKDFIDGAEKAERRAPLKLTSEGWEAK